MNDHPLIISLRERFAAGHTFAWTPEWPVGGAQSGAGVLIAIEPSPRGGEVILTRRTDHLYHHPGQIALPGGRIETSDASATAAALRETEEEIGLRPQALQVLGALPDYATSSGFRVTPVVALVTGPFEPVLDTFEVAELFRVPLGFVLDAQNYQRHRVERSGAVRHFYAVPHAGRFIWGATAGMLAMLAGFAASAATLPAGKTGVYSAPIAGDACLQCDPAAKSGA